MAVRERTKMVAPGGTRPPKPSTKPRRLTPAVEQQIRDLVAEPGTNLPSIRILLAEIDALRAELADSDARLLG